MELYILYFQESNSCIITFSTTYTSFISRAPAHYQFSIKTLKKKEKKTDCGEKFIFDEIYKFIFFMVRQL